MGEDHGVDEADPLRDVDRKDRGEGTQQICCEKDSGHRLQGQVKSDGEPVGHEGLEHEPATKGVHAAQRRELEHDGFGLAWPRDSPDWLICRRCFNRTGESSINKGYRKSDTGVDEEYGLDSIYDLYAKGLIQHHREAAEQRSNGGGEPTYHIVVGEEGRPVRRVDCLRENGLFQSTLGPYPCPQARSLQTRQ